MRNCGIKMATDLFPKIGSGAALSRGRLRAINLLEQVTFRQLIARSLDNFARDKRSDWNAKSPDIACEALGLFAAESRAFIRTNRSMRNMPALNLASPFGTSTAERDLSSA